MLEFKASYLPVESQFKNFASNMTIYNTPSLPPCRVISWNFKSALNSWTQNCLFLCFRRLSEQTRMQKYIYGNFANFNPRAVVNTSGRKNNALQTSVFYQTALCTCNCRCRNITELFVNISRIFGISRRTSCTVFSKIYILISRTCPPRP